jgi:hypothetical protein
MSILTNSIRPTGKHAVKQGGGSWMAGSCYRCDTKAYSVNNYKHPVYKRVCTECRTKLNSYKLLASQPLKGVDKG